MLTTKVTVIGYFECTASYLNVFFTFFPLLVSKWSGLNIIMFLIFFFFLIYGSTVVLNGTHTGQV